jgi:hypothetical protein
MVDRENVPLKAEKVGQGSDGEIQHNIHAARVYGVDEIYPIINSPPVRIQDRKVKRRIT